MKRLWGHKIISFAGVLLLILTHDLSYTNWASLKINWDTQVHIFSGQFFFVLCSFFFTIGVFKFYSAD